MGLDMEFLKYNKKDLDNTTLNGEILFNDMTKIVNSHYLKKSNNIFNFQDKNLNNIFNGLLNKNSLGLIYGENRTYKTSLLKVLAYEYTKCNKKVLYLYNDEIKETLKESFKNINNKYIDIYKYDFYNLNSCILKYFNDNTYDLVLVDNVINYSTDRDIKNIIIDLEKIVNEYNRNVIISSDLYFHEAFTNYIYEWGHYEKNSPNYFQIETILYCKTYELNLSMSYISDKHKYDSLYLKNIKINFDDYSIIWNEDNEIRINDSIFFKFYPNNRLYYIRKPFFLLEWFHTLAHKDYNDGVLVYGLDKKTRDKLVKYIKENVSTHDNEYGEYTEICNDLCNVMNVCDFDNNNYIFYFNW